MNNSERILGGKRVCLLAVMLLSMSAGAELIPSVSELLDRYTQALEATFNFIEDYEQTTQFAWRLASGADSGTGIERGHIRHDGKRCYHRCYRWGDYNIELKDLPPDQPTYHCGIIDSVKKTNYLNTTRLTTPDNPGKVYRHPLQTEVQALLNTQFGAAYLMGYVNSDLRLDTILHQTKRISVRSKPETVNGAVCYVLDAETDHGRYAIWLDSQHGWLPAQIHQRGVEGSISYGHRLTKDQTAVHYLKNVRFEQIDGTWVAMEADAGCNRRTPEGYIVKEDYHYKRTQIKLNPDHEKLGSFADPLFDNPANDPQLTDGTHIQFGIPSKEYLWQDGELIPKEK